MEPPSRLLRRELPIFALFGAVVALVHTWPVLASGENWGVQDWDQHFFYQAVPRASWLKYHQVPLWNPYYCGGAPLLANPQSRTLAPTVPLVLIFDVVRGLKIEVWVNLVIGMAGMYALARERGVDRIAACVAAGVYMLGTMYSLILASGATNFLSIAWVPWTVWTFLRGFGRPGYAAASGLFLAVTYLSGGHWVVPIVALFLVLYAVLSGFTHGWRRSLGVLLLTGVMSVGFGAIKVIPSLEVIQRYPRQIRDYSGYSVAGLAAMLLERDQRLERVADFEQKPGFWSGMTMEMSENGMYVGVVPLVLCAMGLLLRFRRHWRLGVTMMVFLWLCMGSRPPVSLWDVLHRVPYFDNLQMAMRFRIVFLLCAALFAGLGLGCLTSWVSRRTGKPGAGSAVGLVVLAFVFADLMLVTRPIFKATFPIRPAVVMSGIEPLGEFRQIWRLPAYDKNGPRSLDWFDHTPLAEVPLDVSYSALYPAFLTNRGTVYAYEAIPFPRNAVPEDHTSYRGEYYLEYGRGSASLTYWSPNRLELLVRADAADTLVINQNFDPDWTVTGSASDQCNSEGGLLAAEVSPETRRVVFAYRPMSFYLGATVTALTVIGSLLVPAVRHRSRSARPAGKGL